MNKWGKQKRERFERERAKLLEEQKRNGYQSFTESPRSPMVDDSPQSGLAHAKSDLESEISDTPQVAILGLGGSLKTLVRTVTVLHIKGLRAKERERKRRESKENGLSEDELRKEIYRTEASETIYSEFPELDNKYTPYLLLATFVATLSALEVGFNTALLNVPETQIREALRPDKTSPADSVNRLSDAWWSFLVSSFCVGGFIGSYWSGIIANNRGRKNFLLLNNMLFISGGLLMALAPTIPWMVLGRILCGIGCGGVTVVVPLYLGELAPAGMRGTLGTFTQLAIVSGLLFVILISKPLSIDSNNWRYLVGIPIIPAALQTIAAPFLPESPRWLVTQGRGEEASDLLCLLRDQCDIKFNVKAIAQTEKDVKNAVRRGISKVHGLLTNAELRFPLVIATTLHIAQQFSGINVVFYYSTSIFLHAHVPDPWIGSVLAAAVNAISTLLAVRFIETLGRRILLLLSAAGMFLASVFLTWILLARGVDPESELDVVSTDSGPAWIDVMSVVCVLVFVVAFELGLGPIPWLICAEIFPSDAGSTATVVTSSINWAANFVVGLCFPFIQRSLGDWTFIPFACVCALSFIFSLVAVPETKDKTYKQIVKELYHGHAAIAHALSRK